MQVVVSILTSHHKIELSANIFGSKVYLFIHVLFEANIYPFKYRKQGVKIWTRQTQVYPYIGRNLIIFIIDKLDGTKQKKNV